MKIQKTLAPLGLKMILLSDTFYYCYFGLDSFWTFNVGHNVGFFIHFCFCITPVNTVSTSFGILSASFRSYFIIQLCKSIYQFLCDLHSDQNLQFLSYKFSTYSIYLFVSIYVFIIVFVFLYYFSFVCCCCCCCLHIFFINSLQLFWFFYLFYFTVS